jgi:beta-lactamase regulating signal transducer with metallopeptidase domain
MSAESFTACERLLSATANGVYQGVLVAALAGLALRFFPRTNAATRHAVWFGVLLFVTALIPAHLFLSSRPRPEILTTTTPPASSMMAAALAPLDEGNPAGPPVASTPISDSQPVECEAAGESGSDAGREAGAIRKPFSWKLETAISLPHSICLGLVSAWVLLAGVRGWLMARRIGEVRRVKTTANPPGPELQALFERLRRSLAAGRKVRLRISSTHRTAVVLGFVHPVVLLPTDMDLDANPGEVEQVLRHELAHVNRRDDWGNLAQQLIQAALFFHPAVWWISAKISLEREIACDDHVLEASGSPRAYALTLANVASRMSHCRHLLAPGVSNNNSQLQQRITMILNTNRDMSPRLARNRLGLFTTATAILAVLAINAGPRLVLAQSLPETAATTTTAAATLAPVAIASAPDGAADGLPPDGLGPESGPRAKPDDGNDFAAPAAPTLPVTTALPAAAPVAAAPAAPPAPPTPRARKKNMSVEERLDRLERALEKLEAHDGTMGRASHGSSYSADSGAHGMSFSHAMPIDSKADMELKQAADELKRAMDQAQREVEAGQREVAAGQRAAQAGQRTAEQAMRDIAKSKSKDYARLQQKYSEMESEAPLKELQALRSARESLERELQNISRQIKRLEQDQSRPKNPAQGQSDDAKGGQNPAPAKTL